MNPLNDLIQSHNMYDAMEQHFEREVEQTEPQPYLYQQGEPPEAFFAHTGNTPVHHAPQFSHPQAIPYSMPVAPQTPSATSYPTVHMQVAPQPYQTEQERHTMHTMMREISLMQRRLSGMITSLEAMMERTDILHEYHHISRYSSERAAAAYTTTTPTQPRYTAPSHSSPVTHYHGQGSVRQVIQRELPYQQFQHTNPYQSQTQQQVQYQTTAPPAVESPMSIKEGVFNGTHMISAEGDIYAIPVSFLCDQKLIEGDIMQAMVFASGQIKYKLSEPTPREHIMGILSTHSGTSPFYIVQTANKAYNVLKEAVELAGATPGKQILLTVPAGGESEWATIEKVFS